MACPILVDPVLWNRKFVSVQVSLQPRPAINYAEIKINPLQTPAYSLHGADRHSITLHATRQKRRFRIKINHLDELAVQEDTEQKVLGEIELHFRLEQSRVKGQPLQYHAETFTCQLTVQSPYAYPLNNSSSSHTRHIACSCWRVESIKKEMDLPKHCIQISHDAQDSPPKIESLRVSRQATLDSLISNLTPGTGQRIIWFHGWPGCGKTTLLQDLVAQPSTKTGNWIPILMPIVDENSAALKTAWRFMWEVDQRIHAIVLQASALQEIKAEWADLPSIEQSFHIETIRSGLVEMNLASAIDALKKAENALIEEGEYLQDPYLKLSREFNSSLGHLLKYKELRLLLVLDGFYHFEDLEDEVYLNLVRLAHLLKEDSFKRFTLLVTDVMNFDERLAHLETKNQGKIADKLRDGLSGMVRNIACDHLAKDEIERFVTLVFGNRINPAFVDRLVELTRHPVLLKAILHRARWLYLSHSDTEGKKLVLSRCLAQQLRQRYYQQGILTENENRVLQMLLDRQDPKSKLAPKIGKFSVDEAISGLQNKMLVTPQIEPWWPVEETM